MATTARPRIGIAGLSCECCTFSPSLTCEQDFVLLAGDELLAEYGFLAEYTGIDFVPLFRARALPGGPIEPVFYDCFKQRLLDELTRLGPWDGLFLHLHGAANVDGTDDIEGDLLCAIRSIVGPRCLISASYDLHGNVSERVIENLDILTAYRTAPHVDWRDTIERACTLLVRCLGDGLRADLHHHLQVRDGHGLSPGAVLHRAGYRRGVLDGDVPHTAGR